MKSYDRFQEPESGCRLSFHTAACILRPFSGFVCAFVRAIVGLFILFAFSYQLSYAEALPTGKWMELSNDPDIIEFFEDGDFLSYSGKQTITGKWRLLSDGRIKINIDTPLAKLIVLGRIDNKQLLLDLQGKKSHFVPLPESPEIDRKQIKQQITEKLESVFSAEIRSGFVELSDTGKGYSFFGLRNKKKNLQELIKKPDIGAYKQFERKGLISQEKIGVYLTGKRYLVQILPEFERKYVKSAAVAERVTYKGKQYSVIRNITILAEPGPIDIEEISDQALEKGKLKRSIDFTTSIQVSPFGKVLLPPAFHGSKMFMTAVAVYRAKGWKIQDIYPVQKRVAVLGTPSQSTPGTRVAGSLLEIKLPEKLFGQRRMQYEAASNPFHHSQGFPKPEQTREFRYGENGVRGWVLQFEKDRDSVEFINSTEKAEGYTWLSASYRLRVPSIFSIGPGAPKVIFRLGRYVVAVESGAEIPESLDSAVLAASFLVSQNEHEFHKYFPTAEEKNRWPSVSPEVIYSGLCSACHGAHGAGGRGYPVLNDDDWVYGGGVQDIQQTIALGRRGIMVAHGKILTDSEVTMLAAYVVRLSRGEIDEKGKKLFLQKGCIACHGMDGKGMKMLGSVNLTDEIWRFVPGGLGSAAYTIRHGVNDTTDTLSRETFCPEFSERLKDEEILQLAEYILNFQENQNRTPRQPVSVNIPATISMVNAGAEQWSDIAILYGDEEATIESEPWQHVRKIDIGFAEKQQGNVALRIIKRGKNRIKYQFTIMAKGGHDLRDIIFQTLVDERDRLIGTPEAIRKSNGVILIPEADGGVQVRKGSLAKKYKPYAKKMGNEITENFYHAVTGYFVGELEGTAAGIATGGVIGSGGWRFSKSVTESLLRFADEQVVKRATGEHSVLIRDRLKMRPSQIYADDAADIENFDIYRFVVPLPKALFEEINGVKFSIEIKVADQSRSFPRFLLNWINERNINEQMILELGTRRSKKFSMYEKDIRCASRVIPPGFE
ncbi:MAG: c-type cytochrome [gamma proteobacterium endosymbiont of Lamellibrachia anaximandri]|nr:c-type cytochrome [gamma proteobacterium endosymbiont of Lamellibrachia anaximandri]MBL3533207.1 c-type cytochrome [gamma proteobacterium endosymbiont of Lamellibrachia anaximandri]